MLVSVVWVLTHRDQARGYRQAVVIAARLSDSSSALRAVAPIDSGVQPVATTMLGRYPATHVKPAGSEPAPAVVLFVPNGTTTANERHIVRVQRAYAAAGIAAWAVRVPAVDVILASEQSSRIVEEIVTRIAVDEGARPGHISIVAAGPVASLALRAAAGDGPGSDEIRAIIAIQPIADLRVLIRRALTDPTFDPDLRRDAGRALARAARSRVGDRSRIAALLLDNARASDDPIATLRAIPPQVVPASVAGIMTALRATTPAQFDQAWPNTPAGLRASVDRSSPLPIVDRIDARVLLVDDADPGSITRSDVAALADRLDDARTITIDADDPASSIGVRELLGVSAWWLQRAGA